MAAQTSEALAGGEEKSGRSPSSWMRPQQPFGSVVSARACDLGAEGVGKGSGRAGENPCELALGVAVGCTDGVVPTATSTSVGLSAWSGLRGAARSVREAALPRGAVITRRFSGIVPCR